MGGNKRSISIIPSSFTPPQWKGELAKYMHAPKVTVRNFAYKLGPPKWDKIPTTTFC